MKHILLIAGTRPNFIKLAPLFHKIKNHFNVKICHTGQHYDKNMSDSFWHSLKIPDADFKLDTSGGNVSDIIGKTILGLSDIFKSNHFDCVIIFGDVNATVAGAIASVQSGIKVMHVESGLRSFDRTMPEEINRIISDHISDILFVSEESGLINLKNEGISPNIIHFVGNIMIENLINTQNLWQNIILPFNKILFPKSYFVATFHRPENVDTFLSLNKILSIIEMLSLQKVVMLPLHPRTKSKLIEFNLMSKLTNNKNIISTEPLSYFEFVKLISDSYCTITDSGGIQEETSYLNIPCVTFRNNTERPVTLNLGTNLLLSTNDDNILERIKNHMHLIANRSYQSIPLWDSKVSDRILEVMVNQLK